MKIFVYGGTGTVGQVLIQHLLNAGRTVVAGSRRPEEQNAQPGLSWVQVDDATHEKKLSDSEQAEKIRESLQEIDSLFLMAPPGYTDQYGLLHPWIAAAKAAGVKKIVLMTAMGVEAAPAEAPFRKLELALIDSGVSYTILRPNWFMQNFFTFWLAGIAKDRKIYFPGGDAITSFVDARDIARVAAVVLDPDRNSGEELAVTGPAAIDHAEVARIISDATGIPIQYEDIDSAQFEAGLIQAGLPADYAAFLVQIAGALKAGAAAPIADTVQKITGSAAIDFASFAKAHHARWS